MALQIYLDTFWLRLLEMNQLEWDHYLGDSTAGQHYIAQGPEIS